MLKKETKKNSKNEHEKQCSEPSGGPTGDGGDNAKRTGRVAQDGTASVVRCRAKSSGDGLGGTAGPYTLGHS